MERPLYRQAIAWLILLLLQGQPGTAAQQRQTTGNSFQDMIYRAYVHDRMSLWESTLEAMEAEYARNPSPGLLYDILLAQYGLTGYYLSLDQERRAREVLDRAEDRLEALRGIPGYGASSRVFQAAFNAFRISMRPILGVRLGPRSYRLIDEAIEMDEEYPRAWIEKGNLLFFAPAVFGGSKTRAAGYYEQAIALMERDMPANHRWLYLSTLVSLANAYEKTGRLAMAIGVLEKALDYEPDFKWVKEELLPEFRKKQ